MEPDTPIEVTTTPADTPVDMGTPTDTPTAEQTIKEAIDSLRLIGKEQTRVTELLMRPELYDEVFYTEYPGADAGKMKANIMLSVRHSEDAVMRLGKVIEHMGNGRID